MPDIKRMETPVWWPNVTPDKLKLVTLQMVRVVKLAARIIPGIPVRWWTVMPAIKNKAILVFLSVASVTPDTLKNAPSHMAMVAKPVPTIVTGTPAHLSVVRPATIFPATPVR
jgi:hypothetical protein